MWCQRTAKRTCHQFMAIGLLMFSLTPSFEATRLSDRHRNGTLELWPTFTEDVFVAGKKNKTRKNKNTIFRQLDVWKATHLPNSSPATNCHVETSVPTRPHCRLSKATVYFFDQLPFDRFFFTHRRMAIRQIDQACLLQLMTRRLVEHSLCTKQSEQAFSW